MTDELDPAERRIARALTDFAETPFPARGPIDLVISRAIAEGSGRTTRMRVGALLAAAVVFAVGLGALSQLGVLVPAATPSPTATPVATTTGVGTLHLTTDPDGYYFQDPLDLTYMLADGSMAAVSDSFPAKTTVFVDTPLPAGQIRVLANELECTGTVNIEPNLETDVVLSLDDDVCAIATTTWHSFGAIDHPEPRTAVGAFVVVDSVLVVRPLDAGSTMEPIRRPANEIAEVDDFDIAPGRYELALEVDGAVLTTMEIDLQRGQEFIYNLRVLAPDVPRDCGDVPATECEAALTGAYSSSYGPGTPAAAHVTAVRVRPASSSGCYEPPVFDVFFDVPDESRVIEVTVGWVPRGVFLACTY